MEKYISQADKIIAPSGKCCKAAFPAGTYIQTGIGRVPIEELKAGDYALTVDGKFHEILSVSTGIGDTIFITGETDLEKCQVESDPDQLFLAKNGPDSKAEWIKAKDLVGHLWCDIVYRYWYPVESVKEGRRGVKLYGLHVKENNTYTVRYIAVDGGKD